MECWPSLCSFSTHDEAIVYDKQFFFLFRLFFWVQVSRRKKKKSLMEKSVASLYMSNFPK